MRDAGDRAAALNSFAVAGGYYRAALELWPEDDPDRPALLFALARMEFFDGETGGERLDEAIAELLKSDQAELAAEAEALAGEAAWHRGNGDEVRRRLAHALELVRTTAAVTVEGLDPQPGVPLRDACRAPCRRHRTGGQRDRDGNRARPAGDTDTRAQQSRIGTTT